MGRFVGLSGIKTNQGGVYFLEGDYVVDVDEVKFFTNRKGLDCFVAGAKIVESTNVDRAPGTVASQVITIKPEILDTVMGNIKQFAGAVLGIVDPDGYVATLDPSGFQPGVFMDAQGSTTDAAGKPYTTGTPVQDTAEAATDRFWDEALEAMVCKEQPVKGTRLKLNVVSVPTKSGGTFSKHRWAPAYVEQPAATAEAAI
jgi:hypothetical protein